MALIEGVSRVHDLEVDTKELLEKAEEISKKETKGIGRPASKAEEN